MLTVLQGDALTTLRTLPAGSVQCCVTSPPYWGLRDYGTAAWEGGSEGCDHQYAKGGRNPETAGKQLTNGGTLFSQYERDCGKCGARRIDSQLGLEPTPKLYVARMVEVFKEVRRVLRKDGTLWLNLGDSYHSQGGSRTSCVDTLTGQGNRREAETDSSRSLPTGCKTKDLVGIPWRVAFALQADGWYLRSDIIWAKPNPMPESVTDRPTKAHEYVFLLSKSSTYFYDAVAIQEPSIHAGRIVAYDGTQKNCSAPDAVNDRRTLFGFNGARSIEVKADRNKRSVWTVPTSPYPDAHFATYPPDLIKPMILAGSKVGDVILDPFAGSGTTGQVALELGRKAVLIELNPTYLNLIHQRCTTTIGLPM